MKFIRDLLGKKRNEEPPRTAPPMDSLEQSYRDTIGSMVDETVPLDEQPTPSDVLTKEVRIVSASAEPKPTEAAAVNIWDLEDDGTASALPEPTATPAAPAAEHAVASAAAARSPARSRRTKTRLIGFDKSDGDVVDLFNDAPKAAPTRSVKFPVGWLVVAEGPGRGESFPLLAGMSQIGRGEDQAVQLDFGDNSISRTNHAAIVFDADTKEFLLGHGGKSNIVRLNDKPLISNETLKSGDSIRIGETVLRFAALCGKSFNWSDGTTEEDEDVAIA
ncbi:FHA domain-containing protein [Yoonia maricola]|uniref:FHA domain-containing protein n=1 Tax=Yoonia maricola TaxID=420999 RepID=A0A2M8W5Q2_9RHOB|nr:FHA domain-containing protein [Yoonia maricola]PJI86238.1 FHA domain-containing protein [Yoonia maricola]